jgi:hypothetical protein
LAYIVSCRMPLQLIFAKLVFRYYKRLHDLTSTSTSGDTNIVVQSVFKWA